MEIITVYDCVVNFISPALLFFHRSHNTQDNGENPGDLFNLSRRVARIRPNFSGPSRLIDRLFRGEFSRMLMTRSYFHASPLFLFPPSGGQFRGSLRHSFISRPPPRFGRVRARNSSVLPLEIYLGTLGSTLRFATERCSSTMTCFVRGWKDGLARI